MAGAGERRFMWDRYIQDLRIELERIIPHKCYWYVLIEAVQTISIDGHIMNITLPLPCIFGTLRWNDEWKYREHNEAEIKRVRDIWNQLIEQMKEKLKK